MDSRLVPQLTELMEKYEIRPEQLNLEITETTALDVNKYVAENLGKLIDMGCGFSMDDYGTGYSNLSQIVDMTFDIAKLDKSLVWGYFEATNHKQRVLLSSTVEMFHRLEMQLVAEGVETAEQADVLQRMGVEYLQGYFYSKPIPPNEFKNFLIENAAEAS
jgi:EAL domain-containing protein (putative c-di-GMP-specific phosphodiesterase class I)